MTTTADRHLGSGLVIPLRRQAGRDFVWATGLECIRSSLRQLLMTDPGDLPWRPAFGAGLRRLLHQNLTEELRHAVEARIVAAVERYEPRVRIVAITLEAVGTSLYVQLDWALALGSARSGVEVTGPAVGVLL